MSFKKAQADVPPLASDSSRFTNRFLEDVAAIEQSALDNPLGNARIELADARVVDRQAKEDGAQFDLIVTSPPYPNRMSYIRELRPYMYWLGFLNDAKQAGELDWEAIGGTWGVATSRLLSWEPSDASIPPDLPRILEAIRAGHPKNGELMARYVHKYFDDMFHHFRTAHGLMKPGGTVHYIVGNSTFYGHIVPAERFYVEQMSKAGFKNAEAKPIRKRNSKKELVEFHVGGER